MVCIERFRLIKLLTQSFKLNFYLKSFRSKRLNFNKNHLEANTIVTVLIFPKKVVINKKYHKNKIGSKISINTEKAMLEHSTRKTAFKKDRK